MTNSTEASDYPTARRAWPLPVMAVVVAVVAFLVYLPCLDNGFVNWDDDKNFLNNPHFGSLSLRYVWWSMTTTHMGPYQPLSWLTLGLDRTIWGMNPRGYHFTNVVLHAATAGTLCLLIGALLSRIRLPRVVDGDFESAGEASFGVSAGLALAAAFGALAWAVHPQRVESVAWITERRDVLSGVLYVLCVWFSLRSHEHGVTESTHHRRQRLALACCGLALLSKATAVSIPLVLVVLDVYPLRRLRGWPWQWVRQEQRRVLLEKHNYILFSVLAVVVGFVGQAQAEAMRTLDQIGLVDRVLIALHANAFYVGKLVWPTHLAPIYPRPETIGLSSSRLLLGAGFSIGVTVALLHFRRRWPGGLAAWACYVGALVPVCGLVTIGDELVADRYSYLPTMAVFALLSGVWLRLWRVRIARAKRVVVRVLLLVLAGSATFAFGLSTRRLIPVWEDSLSLWAYATARRPESHKAWNNLAGTLADRQHRRYEEAAEACRRALAIRPDFASAHYNLGVALIRLGEYAEGETALRRALALGEDSARLHAALGTVLNWLDRPEEAIEHLERALRLQPARVPNAHFQLGEAYRKLGKIQEATRHYERAVRIQPGGIGPHAGLADVYLSQDRIAEAEKHALIACSITRLRPQGRYALVQVRTKQGRYDEALRMLRALLQEFPPMGERALSDPHLRELRTQPRFRVLLRGLLPPATSRSIP